MASWRVLLVPPAYLYAGAARLRAWRWRGRARRLPHPVLSVGNLTFGGTGKTPFVIHAAEELRRRGLRPAILSRGYRAEPGGGNDEARVIARNLPDVPHVPQPDRYAAGLALAARADVYLLDDGFQHLPLARDADVVLVDATDPFGGGFCPPAGRLREPLSALGRATHVVLTRCDLAGPGAVGEVMREVRARTSAPIVTSRFRACCDPPLEGLEVLAACAVGNPRAFLLTVERLGARIREQRLFRDHHRYGAADAAALARQGLPVVVTEKDLVKLQPLWPAGGPPLLVVRIAFEPLDGAEALEALFDSFRRP